MKNKTLRALFEAMANNRPYLLGTDYYVSIQRDSEDSFKIVIFHESSFSWFLPSGLLTDFIAYATAFHLFMSVQVKHDVPVIVLNS